MHSEIEELKKEINQLDSSLIELLQKRAEIVKKIVNIKIKMGIPIEDKNREKEILSKIKDKSIQEIYGEFFKHAKNSSLPK